MRARAGCRNAAALSIIGGMRIRRAPVYALLLSLVALAACPADSTSPKGPPVAAGWSVLPNGPVRPDRNHHMDITFINADTGWMVDIDGRLWRTQDGGASWALVNFNTSVFMRSVAFISPTHGFVGNLNNFVSPVPGVALWETT